jgi:dTDP-4-amino-4,6-dideoxygalactose transaminase
MLNRSLSALDSRPDSSHMKIGRMTPGDLALLERRLPSLPSIVAAHRRNASALLNALSGGTFQLPLASRAVTHEYYLFALRFHSEDGRARAQARLQRAGIGAFQLYRVALEKARAHGYRGDCPNAETAARNVVMLPVHPKVSEVAIGMMSDQLSQFRDVDR